MRLGSEYASAVMFYSLVYSFSHLSLRYFADLDFLYYLTKKEYVKTSSTILSIILENISRIRVYKGWFLLPII